VISLRPFGILLICIFWFLASCGGGPAVPVAPAAREEQQTYMAIRQALAKDGGSIDYDTLMDVYRKMASSPVPIPHMEELLREMIDQRSTAPRIDQMVLIIAAHVIGNSQFPIPDAQALFERILDQDADRISYWVLTFVAEAIGKYPVDLPGGDLLVNRVQAWQARLDNEGDVEKEHFGTHFLPPPESQLIQAHLAGITDQRVRQLERNAYYGLIKNDIPESTIVAAFGYLMRRGLPGSGEIPPYPLAALVRNWQFLPQGWENDGNP
jgi:hypothetical protein